MNSQVLTAYVMSPTRTLLPTFIGSTMEEMKLRTLLNTDCMELDVATMNTISITLVLQSVAEYEQIFNNSETVHRN